MPKVHRTLPDRQDDDESFKISWEERVRKKIVEKMRLLGNLCDAFQPAARRLHASSSIAAFAAERGAYESKDNKTEPTNYRGW